MIDEKEIKSDQAQIEPETPQLGLKIERGVTFSAEENQMDRKCTNLEEA
jgi:hypothetical protein